MTTSEPRYLEFDADRLDEVVAAMEALSEAHSGWVNFQPAVAVEDVPPPPSQFFGLFSNKGPQAPLGTWTPAPPPRGDRPEPPMIGLQHPAGTRAKGRLAELGHALPEKWIVLQDHARKGLVVAVPPTVAHSEVVAWLLRAGSLLSEMPLTGTWRAAVYAS